MLTSNLREGSWGDLLHKFNGIVLSVLTVVKVKFIDDVEVHEHSEIMYKILFETVSLCSTGFPESL